MKMNHFFSRFAFASACLGTFTAVASGTAFDLVKDGNRYVGEQSKDKVVQIRSEKSDNTLAPDAWSVVYYDPTATLKAVEVKYENGQMVSVKRPMRLIGSVSGKDTPLAAAKLKVDSDAALKTAMSDASLGTLKISAVRLRLEGMGEGVLNRSDPTEPVWKIRFWLPKSRHHGSDADVGEIWVSADDGKIVQSDLHLQNAD